MFNMGIMSMVCTATEFIFDDDFNLMRKLQHSGKVGEGDKIMKKKNNQQAQYGIISLVWSATELILILIPRVPKVKHSRREGKEDQKWYEKMVVPDWILLKFSWEKTMMSEILVDDPVPTHTCRGVRRFSFREILSQQAKQGFFGLQSFLSKVDQHGIETCNIQNNILCCSTKYQK